MEKKRPYGRRRTGENRQTAPKQRRTDGAPEKKRPYRNGRNENRYYEEHHDSKNGRRRRENEYRRRDDSRPARMQKKSVTAQKEDGGLVRLNKFIANSGICSRREADTYIQTGLVSVNGQRVTELGTKVNPVTDDIRFNGERLRGEKKVYILMNKPKDFVTTLADPHAERTVMDLISKSLCPERVYPVGRLDKATTGVLLLTNDGDLAEKLTHPSNGIRKIYQAQLDKNLRKEDFDKILGGIELDDGFIAADALSYVDSDKATIGLEIHSGRNRIVRRIFEHLGYKVKKLDRVYFAGMTKKSLRRGAWRFLEDKEVGMLKMGAFE